MANRKSLEGYRSPFVAGRQQGEGLLPNGGFLPVKAAQAVAAIVPIPLKWPDRKGYKPIIPSKSAFNQLQFESIESIKERWCIS